MTTRLGNAAEQLLRNHRGKRLCNLVRITRADGYILRLTDHDRQIYFEGEAYQPARAAAMSSDRREAGFRSQSQEAFGVIDGVDIQVPDLLGDRYSGAEVRHVVTDWSMPWLWFGKHRRWIRQIEWVGSVWKATLDGRAAMLQRPVGGPRAGTFTRQCPYRLGQAECGVDVSVGGGNAYIGVRVDTVTNQMAMVFESAGWPGSFDDDWFRDGEIVWLFGTAESASTITSDTTSTEIEDSAQAWSDDEHVGKLVTVYDGSGGGFYAEITGNDSTHLYFDEVDADVLPTGSDYEIAPKAANYGHVSPIVAHRDAARELDFLLPSPFPVVAGDGGVLRVGCDGLRGTCKTKFSNLDNFGGDPLAPTPADILEPPT